MAKKLYFDFRDIFRAARMGFKGKKILMHFLGLMLGYVIYEILVYLTALSGGNQYAGEIWQKYGLNPLLFLMPTNSNSVADISIITIVAMLIGGICWLIIYLLFSTAVCKVAVEELRGDDFYSIREAIKFATKNGKSIYVSVLGLIAIIIFCLFWSSLVGLIDLIPKVEVISKHLGTPITTFLTVPIYFLGLFMILTLFAFIFGLSLIPAIVAVTGEDTFETIYQLYATIWNQPWRLVLYNKLLWIISLLGIIIFASISFAGTYIAYLPSMLLAKQESFYIADIIARALKIVGAGCLIQIIPGANLATASSMTWTLDLSTFFLFVSFIIIGAIIMAYPLAICSCGQTLIYVILRRKTTDENMLEITEEIIKKESDDDKENKSSQDI